MVHDLDEVFAQEVIRESDDESSSTSNDLSVNATVFARLSKTFPGLGLDSANFIKGLVDELEASKAASAKTGKEGAWYKVLVSEADNGEKNVFNDVASLLERVVVSGTSEV